MTDEDKISEFNKTADELREINHRLAKKVLELIEENASLKRKIEAKT